MKTSITESNASITIKYTCKCGKRHVREFRVSSLSDWSYVRELTTNGHRQVGECLATTGNMLTASPATLHEVIRKEWRKARKFIKESDVCYECL